MYKSRTGAGYRPGQARYANAVYRYKPDFTGDYKEGVVDESERHVVFEFQTPYIIAATPPNAKPWGIYEAGCKNGLVLHGKADCPVSVSLDAGKSWKDAGKLADGPDLTDLVKGRRQYHLRLGAGAKDLKEAALSIVTVCQVNSSILPRLKDNGTCVTFEASSRGIVSAGPNLDLAEAHRVAGSFGTPQVTLELAAPRKEPGVALYAAAHVLSSSPPSSDIKYQIEYSLDGGKSWQFVVKDWAIARRGDEPKDFWSQSLCWGSVELKEAAGPVQVRFRNSGGKAYARAEAHLVYKVSDTAETEVVYSWSDSAGRAEAAHVFAAGARGATWNIVTGRNVETHWVEFATR
jgi:hypothetical protein